MEERKISTGSIIPLVEEWYNQGAVRVIFYDRGLHPVMSFISPDVVGINYGRSEKDIFRVIVLDQVSNRDTFDDQKIVIETAPYGLISLGNGKFYSTEFAKDITKMTAQETIDLVTDEYTMSLDGVTPRVPKKYRQDEQNFIRRTTTLTGRRQIIIDYYLRHKLVYEMDSIPQYFLTSKR